MTDMLSGMATGSSSGSDESPEGASTGQKVGRTLFALLGIVSAALAALVLFFPMERQVLGIVMLVLTVTLMMMGVHVAVSLALPSLLGLWAIGGAQSVAYALEQVPKNSAASWILSVIPTFIFMGLMVSRSGIAAIIFDAAKQWIGRIPGGLGIATIFAGAGMSAASGSTLGVTYATSRMGIPEMLRSGYQPRMAVGTVAMAGTLKMLIPPSVTVVIYAGIAQTPVGPQLLAGIVPGLVLAALYALLILVRVKMNPALAPAVDLASTTWRTRFVALVRAWPVALVVLIVVGGMYSGVATATEAGALAALATILISGWMRRRDGFKSFVKLVGVSIVMTIGSVAAIMLLIISVNILTVSMASTGVVQAVSQFVVDLGPSRTVFLLVLVVMYLVMGMLMDELAMMLLTMPVLVPILEMYEVDMIWFGVFLILLCEVGTVVPPVGMLSFVVHAVAQQEDVNLGHKISLVDVFRGTAGFVAVALAFIVFLIFVPELVLWLPRLSS